MDRTLEILNEPKSLSWNGRWLKILRIARSKGFHPVARKYGNGDNTSYRLIEDVVHTTWESGAVRHGAECFNFYFPQELDDTYLIIWEKLATWEYRDEKGVRSFLRERIADGYRFPVNPVWPVRDEGWYEIYEELKSQKPVFPPELDQRIQSTHRAFPNGFIELQRGDDSVEDKADLNPVEHADLILHHSNLWKELKNLLRIALDMTHLGSDMPKHLRK